MSAFLKKNPNRHWKESAILRGVETKFKSSFISPAPPPPRPTENGTPRLSPITLSLQSMLQQLAWRSLDYENEKEPR